MMQNTTFVVLQRGEKMDELISKQAAIDAIMQWESESFLTINNLIDKKVARAIIEDLPSTQPEIIRCGDCKYGMLDSSFPHQWFCKYKGDEWNNSDYFCGHAKRREVTT